jgi:hypothetical protein
MTLGRKITLSDLSPSHPFARTSIFIGGPQPPKQKAPLPMGRHGVTLSVEWGYNRYYVKIGAARWRRIRQGEAMMIHNKQWYEGKPFNCCWFFDYNADPGLQVDYGEDGGTGFIGDIRDAWIDERQPGE